MFIYMGRVVSEGGGIGREVIDNKFPTVGLLMSGPWRVFGACWPAWVLMLTAMGLAGPILLARSAGRNLGQHTALPTLCFALIYLNFSYGIDGFHLEAILVFFAAIAASAALSAFCSDDARDSFLVGLAAATGAMLKPSALASLAAFAVVMFLHLWRRPKRLAVHGLAALLGAVIPGAVTLAYLFGSNLLREVPVISRQIARYAAQSEWQVFDLVKWAIAIVVIGFPLLVRGLTFRQKRDRVTRAINVPVLTFALLWIAIEAMGVTMQGRMYKYHFLVLTPAAALLFGMLPRGDRLFPLIAALILPLFLSLFGSIPPAGELSSPTRHLASSDYLLAHARPGEGVWEDGMPRLLLETGLRPGSPYVTTFLWANDDDSPAKLCSSMIDDFNQMRPKFIILSTDLDQHVRAYVDGIEELAANPRRAAAYREASERLHAYVEHNYVPEAQVHNETVYVRRIGSVR